MDGIALCNHAPRKLGHFCRKPSRGRIQNYLPHAGSAVRKSPCD